MWHLDGTDSSRSTAPHFCRSLLARVASGLTRWNGVYANGGFTGPYFCLDVSGGGGWVGLGGAY